MVGSTCVRHWSKTQANITLSSGDAELVALVKGVSEGLGVKSLSKDLGLEVEGGVFTAASAVLGLVNRRGLGNLVISSWASCGCRSVCAREMWR